MSAPPPVQLVIGPRGHGVVDYAADLAAAVQRLDDRTAVVHVRDLRAAQNHAKSAERVHVHVTDRLLGGSPEEAAVNLESLAAVTRLTISIHDAPQTSDGRSLSRRIAAYTRFLHAADGAVVNSGHEQLLVAEFLPGAPTPHPIPLGTRDPSRSPRSRPAPVPHAQRDLTVLIAGHVYPGKGHAQAIDAAADAGRTLTASGERVGKVVVRAIGAPSPGHADDIVALGQDAAARGVRFEVTGFLTDDDFSDRMNDEGIPVAAHQHVSASRSMLDWIEKGRRPLVAASRYAEEMTLLRPGTMTLYGATELPSMLMALWRDPERSRLDPAVSLAPSILDAAAEYRAWWAGLAP